MIRHSLKWDVRTIAWATSFASSTSNFLTCFEPCPSAGWRTFPSLNRPLDNFWGTKTGKRRKKLPAKNFGALLGTTFSAREKWDSTPLSGLAQSRRGFTLLGS